jgi:exodeoxyribonuclease VII large subunit
MPNSDLFAPDTSRNAAIIRVSELNRRARGLLEAHLELMWVAGEVSNFTRATSGHWYFVLKDKDAQVRCVMFRNKAALLGFVPENGMQVEVHALPSLYEPRGEFQLGVETLRRAGLGALFEAFERLKARLASEGLFDAERKKTLPAFPRRIGIVTSPQAAALHDVLTTLKRRAPMIEVIIYPAPVQGASAAREIAAAIGTASARNECDALIVCRGGGSIEDLWSYNEESVARAIAACPIPVVSGVGHETDVTIADFVADRRAPTPTAAAEMLSPNRSELIAGLATRATTMQRAMQRLRERIMQRLDRARRGLLSPAQQLARERERLAACKDRLARGHAAAMQQRQWKLAHARQALLARRPGIAGRAARLRLAASGLKQARMRCFDLIGHRLAQARDALPMLNPQRILERGYSIVETARGDIVRSARQTPAGASLTLRFAEGRVAATVDTVLDAGVARNAGEPGV